MSGRDTTTEGAETLNRAAMFAAGPPKIPRKTVWIALGVVAVLGIGGAFADHSFNVPSASTSTPVIHHSARQRQTLAQFVGLKTLSALRAPAIDLTDGGGGAYSLGQLAGRPVILTFLGATCAETCLVIAPELVRAEAILSRAHVRPAVVIVNADPRHLSVASVHTALHTGPLASLTGAMFLTGSITQLQPIWKSYGVTIEVDPTTNELAYTNVIYLIDQMGRLRDSLTPFANESFSGSATLPIAQLNRFASGIAFYLEQIAR
jgi:cytochrome oxidase Cu insertion factor (SCO1/SenC/PrrC family)